MESMEVLCVWLSDSKVQKELLLQGPAAEGEGGPLEAAIAAATAAMHEEELHFPTPAPSCTYLPSNSSPMTVVDRSPTPSPTSYSSAPIPVPPGGMHARPHVVLEEVEETGAAYFPTSFPTSFVPSTPTTSFLHERLLYSPGAGSGFMLDKDASGACLPSTQAGGRLVDRKTASQLGDMNAYWDSMYLE